VLKIIFYYTSSNLFTIEFIVVSEGYNFDCLMAPSRAQCRPVALYVYAQIAYYSVFGCIFTLLSLFYIIYDKFNFDTICLLFNIIKLLVSKHFVLF